MVPTEKTKTLPYPELEKANKVKEASQLIGEFCQEFLPSKGIHLLRWDEDSAHGRALHSHTPIQELLAEFFGIDLAKLDREKAAMLDEIRRANDEAELAQT